MLVYYVHCAICTLYNLYIVQFVHCKVHTMYIVQALLYSYSRYIYCTFIHSMFFLFFFTYLSPKRNIKRYIQCHEICRRQHFVIKFSLIFLIKAKSILQSAKINSALSWTALSYQICKCLQNIFCL